jgi:hypothetical protein
MKMSVEHLNPRPRARSHLTCRDAGSHVRDPLAQASMQVHAIHRELVVASPLGARLETARRPGQAAREVRCVASIGEVDDDRLADVVEVAAGDAPPDNDEVALDDEAVHHPGSADLVDRQRTGAMDAGHVVELAIEAAVRVPDCINAEGNLRGLDSVGDARSTPRRSRAEALRLPRLYSSVPETRWKGA